MKNPISVSILELAIITQGSNPTETFQKTKEIAQLADQLGYKRFWLAEHHNMAHVASTATVVLIGYIRQSDSKHSGRFWRNHVAESFSFNSS
jgi:hypothetical protein